MTVTTIFIDLETTGLSPTNDEIIEICALRTDTGEIFNRLVKPTRIIPNESINIHHITNQLVENEQPIEIILDKFKEFCQSSYPILFVGHNAWNFDIKFIKNALQKHNITLLPYKVLDTLGWIRHKYPSLDSYKLSNLQKHFDIKHINTHRASDDVYCLHELMEKLRGDINYYDLWKENMKYILSSRWLDSELGILKSVMLEGKELDEIYKLFEDKLETSVKTKIKFLNRSIKNEKYTFGPSNKVLEYHQKFQMEHKSISEIALEMKVSENTVIRNLMKAIQFKLDIDTTKIPNYPSDSEINEIKIYTNTLSDNYRLKIIKSHFGTKYTYNQIQFAISC